MAISKDTQAPQQMTPQSWGLTLAAGVVLFLLAGLVIVHVQHGSRGLLDAQAQSGMALIVALPVRSIGVPATYLLLALVLGTLCARLFGRAVENAAQRAVGLPLIVLAVSGLFGVVTHSEDAALSPMSGVLGDNLAHGLLFGGRVLGTIAALALVGFAVVVGRDWFFYKALRRGPAALDASRAHAAELGSAAASDTALEPTRDDADFIRPLPRKGQSTMGTSLAAGASGAAATVLDLEPLDDAALAAAMPVTSIESAAESSARLSFAESWETGAPTDTPRGTPASERGSMVATADQATLTMRTLPAVQAGEPVRERGPIFGDLTPEMLAMPIAIDDDVTFDGDTTDTLLIQNMGEVDPDEVDMDEEEAGEGEAEDDAAEEGEDVEEDEDFDADDEDEDDDVEFEEEAEDEDADEDGNSSYDDNDIDEDLFAKRAGFETRTPAPIHADVEPLSSEPIWAQPVEHAPHRELAPAAAANIDAPIESEAAEQHGEEAPLWSAAARAAVEPLSAARSTPRAGDDWAAWMESRPQSPAARTARPDALRAAPRLQPAAGAPRVADQTYESVVRTVLERDQCSLSLLQRHLHLSFADAAAAIERMEQEGVVGPYRGSGNREILQSLAAWESRRG
jgi:hypothetical protein